MELKYEYYPRIVDSLLQDKLKSAGAVLIEGTKWCGKSTTAERFAGSAVYLQNTDTRTQNIELAKNAPSLFLKGATPKMIDEWQIIPFIWDQIRFEVDHRHLKGQFILTGSATPVDEDSYEHSGIGRIVPMIMRPMSLFESRDGNGLVSLDVLFNHPEDFEASECSLGLEDYAYLLCRGGWPSTLGLPRKEALDQVYNFYDGLVYTDINKVFKRTKNPERIKRLLRSYSRAISTDMSNAMIRDDVLANDEKTFDDDTVVSYLNALSKLFVVEELPAWNTNLRSKTAIRTSNTRHFVDPSIACASLGVGPDDMINDLETFGLWFESMCIRDLRIYSQRLDGQIYHYRDSKGREADAIIHLRNGKWAAVEVKLSSQESIDDGAGHLLGLAADIDTSRHAAPSFLMVLTTTPYAYRRGDGVYVVPLGCLRD